jgi:type I restriction enzyme S subunit
MEVRAGYKQTEVGVIPDEWQCAQILTVAKLESGHTPSKREPSYWSGSIPWVSLFDTQGLEGEAIFDTAKLITVKGLDNSSARLLPKGTVVFSRTATVGKTTVMGREMATSQDFANYICGPNLHNLFLVYLFRSMGRTWKSLMAGSIHNTIYMPVFKALRIVLPPLTEQHAIAEALSDVDRLLGGLDGLIAKKRDLKQAAMQQLLTGQTRLPGFHGEWEVKRLGDVASLSKGTQLHSSETDEGGKFAHLNGGITPSSYTHKSNTDGNTIAISEGGNSCGFVQFMTEPYWCGGHCYSVIPNDVDNQFLYQALKGQQTAIMALRVGSGLPNVQKTGLLGFKLHFPATLAEQTAIAEVLTEMDAELSGLEQRREKTRALKQAMMQELLTGRTRLI